MIQAQDSFTVDLLSGATQCPVQKSPAKVRKDRVSRATPPWADLGQIYRVYNEAWEMRAHGIPATVDHIYPLAGELVSGLHVHQNLQIVTASDNSAKCNTALPISVLPPLATPQMSLF